MGQPTRAQQVGWVVLLTALGVLAAVRVGCGQTAAGGAGSLPAPSSEGNYGLHNVLSGARAQEDAAGR